MNYYAKKGVEIGKTLPDYFVFADEIDGTRRIQIQGIEQQYIDHSISSTINLPRETEPEVVADLYMKAWKHKLKGVTVYREGSRDGVLVSEEDSKKRLKELEERIHELEEQLDRGGLPASNAPRRPDALDSRTHKIKVDFGDGNPKNTYVTVSFFPGTKRPYEIFLQAPLTGLDEKDLQILELTARSTSMNLRHGLPIQYICEQLDKVGGQYLFSIPTNIAKVLRHYIDPAAIPQDEDAEEDVMTTIPTGGPPSDSGSLGRIKCPECDARTYRLTGRTCGICDSCGYEKCG
jgi:ribonucleoside-diphosphate reductase alpha chain